VPPFPWPDLRPQGSEFRSHLLDYGEQKPGEHRGLVISFLLPPWIRVALILKGQTQGPSHTCWGRNLSDVWTVQGKGHLGEENMVLAGSLPPHLGGILTLHPTRATGEMAGALLAIL
jgi:hypothetical protein